MNTTESTGITCPYADKRNRQSIISSIGLALILIVIMATLKLMGKINKEELLLTAICGQAGLLIWAWGAWATEKKHGRTEAFRQGLDQPNEAAKSRGIEQGIASGKKTFYGKSRNWTYGLTWSRRYDVRILVRKRNKIHVLMVIDKEEYWYRFDVCVFDDSIGDIEYHLITSLSLRQIQGDEGTITVFQDPPVPPALTELPSRSGTRPRKETARINIPDDLLKVGLQDPPNEEE